MRLHRTGLSIIATATLGMSAPTAHADTQYGGTGFKGSRPTGPTTTLVRHDDGRITVRAVSGYDCRNASYVNRVVKLTGTIPDGSSFTATGKTRMSGRGMVRYTMTGTLTPDGVNGSVVERLRRCPTARLNLSLRAASAPAGAAAMPAPGSFLGGLTAQSVGGVRLAIALRVAKNGRVYGNWHAMMTCGPRSLVPMVNVTPATTVKPDGTFSRSETYTIRYSDGSRERFRVNLRGRFLADGAVGTLRARSQLRERGKRFYQCDSGRQTWTARS